MQRANELLLGHARQGEGKQAAAPAAKTHLFDNGLREGLTHGCDRWVGSCATVRFVGAEGEGRSSEKERLWARRGKKTGAGVDEVVGEFGDGEWDGW